MSDLSLHIGAPRVEELRTYTSAVSPEEIEIGQKAVNAAANYAAWSVAALVIFALVIGSLVAHQFTDDGAAAGFCFGAAAAILLGMPLVFKAHAFARDMRRRHLYMDRT